MKDGEGITPDIEVEVEQYSALLATLLNENIVFQFATNYYFNHDSIAQPEEFQLSDSEFESFVEFALTHDFQYKTGSTEMMKELREMIEEDEFMEDVSEEFKALSAKLERDKREDLFKFREEIEMILENEIASRYYYSRGRIRAFMLHDPEITKALEVLNNKSYYDSVIDGTCEGCLTKKG